jgi:hypothetical protein
MKRRVLQYLAKLAALFPYYSHQTNVILNEVPRQRVVVKDLQREFFSIKLITFVRKSGNCHAAWFFVKFILS